MPATPFEIYKAQADVLVPVVRSLLKELGEQRTRELVTDALGDHFRNFGKQVFDSLPDENFGSKIKSMVEMFAQDDALDWEIQQQDEDGLDFRVNRCRYAEFYQQLDAPEIGFLLVCSQDYPLSEGMGDESILRRPLTIMQGHDHCEFAWRRKADPAEVAADRKAEQTVAESEQLRLLRRAAASADQS